MPDTWRTWKQWPELILERLDDAGVARVVLNRPDKRNCLNEALVTAWFTALDLVRDDPDVKAVITKGAGVCFSSGLDLHFLRQVSEAPRDWDRPTPTVRMAETLRAFPRIVIAQVHGYCLGGALGIVNCHDLVFAAEDAQFGMPEILRGSFGQLVTSTLVHGGIPIKKVALMQVVGRNISGAEADRWGIVSQALPAAELETTVTGIAREIAARHGAPLEHAKITVQMGRDLSLSQAIQLDQLVAARMRRVMDPTQHVESYLQSQRAGRIESISGRMCDASWPGSSRPSTSLHLRWRKTWMPGTRPGMTYQSALRWRYAAAFFAPRLSDSTASSTV